MIRSDVALFYGRAENCLRLFYACSKLKLRLGLTLAKGERFGRIRECVRISLSPPLTPTYSAYQPEIIEKCRFNRPVLTGFKRAETGLSVLPMFFREEQGRTRVLYGDLGRQERRARGARGFLRLYPLSYFGATTGETYMPAVMVRPEAFGAELDALAKFMGWDRDKTLGKLTLLWGGSQAAKMKKATIEQIGTWAECKDNEEARRFCEAAIHPTCRWLKRTTSRGTLQLDTYEIVGNSKEIAKIKRWKKRCSDGGRSTRQKWKGKKEQPNPEHNAGADSTLPSLPFPSSPVHSSPSLSPPSPSAPSDPVPPEIARANARLIQARIQNGLTSSGGERETGFKTFGKGGRS